MHGQERHRICVFSLCYMLQVREQGGGGGNPAPSNITRAQGGKTTDMDCTSTPLSAVGGRPMLRARRSKNSLRTAIPLHNSIQIRLIPPGLHPTAPPIVGY